MVNKFRSWLFHVIFGFNPKNLVRFSTKLRDIEERLDVLENQTIVTSKVLLEIAEQTGGFGWTETIQNAIYSLQHQITILEAQVKEHTEFYERFLEEIDEQETPIISSKKDIN